MAGDKNDKRKDDDDASQTKETKAEPFSKTKIMQVDTFYLNSLSEAICQSITAVKNSELRKKLANSIMLVGGLSSIPNAIEFLEAKIVARLCLMDPEIEEVEILNCYNNVDMKTMSWIGATILPKLETSKEFWISREKWVGNVDFEEKEKETEKVEEVDDKEKLGKKKERHNESGIKLLREKSPFDWMGDH